MTTLSASEARKRFDSLLDDIAESHEAVLIAGKRHNAVLISEEDWRQSRRHSISRQHNLPDYKSSEPAPDSEVIGSVAARSIQCGACSRGSPADGAAPVGGGA